MTTNTTRVLIEFVRAWGHPTRNEIYGPGDRARVSEWIADNLERNGYAKRLVLTTNRPQDDENAQ